MNKNIIIGIIALLIIALIAGGVYWMMSIKNQSGNTNMVLDETIPGKSLRELLTSPTPQRCTFAETNETAKNEGVVFIGGGKMRGDFSSTINGQMFNSHMISTNNKINFWLNGQTQGFMMGLDQTDSAQATDATRVDIDKKMTVDCEPWQLDETKFELPAEVTFTDLEATIQKMMPTVPTTDGALNVNAGSKTQATTDKTISAECLACDQAPVEAQQRCRQAFNCQ
ncbi:MAG: hypothetical protein HUU49_03550 [Candidatus Buchananbacteria bacterium]|nr:hypothetical protein [Candidatus Buchananbacteria bacterium]